MKKEYAKDLIISYMYKEKLFQDGWKFEFSKHKTCAGMCYGWRKLIVLSGYYVEHNSDEEIINTMLHEIAHALAPECEHHGKVWRAIFRDLLIKYNQPVNVSRCYDSQKVKMPKGKYLLYCTETWCGKKWERHKKCWWFEHKNANDILTRVNCLCGSQSLKIKKRRNK